jgi:hypothetical protein
MTFRKWDIRVTVVDLSHDSAFAGGWGPLPRQSRDGALVVPGRHGVPGLSGLAAVA